jgi:hypothetical protein
MQFMDTSSSPTPKTWSFILGAEYLGLGCLYLARGHNWVAAGFAILGALYLNEGVRESGERVSELQIFPPRQTPRKLFEFTL